MIGRLGLLGQRVLARHSAPPRAGGLRLARSVAAARVPERIVETSTRLARGRSIGRQPATPAAAAAAQTAALPRPPGMSEFAARWIFGDGPPEGIPIAGEAAMPALAGESEKPSFLQERDRQEEQAAEAEVARRAQPVQRGQVEEVPAGFRLSRKPVERAETPLPPPHDTPLPPPHETPQEIVDETPAPSLEAVAVPGPAPVVPEAHTVSEAPARPVETIRRNEPPASISRVEGPPAPAPLDVPEPPAAADAPATAPSAPAPADPAAPVPEPAPLPRVPLTLARRPAERTVRPALQLHRRPADPLAGPEPVEVPVAEAPAAARPGILRRVVDSVLRRGSSPTSMPPPAAPSEPAAAQQAPTPAAAVATTVSPPPPPAPPRLLARAAEETAAAEPGYHAPPEDAPAPEAAPEPTPPIESVNEAGESAATAVESPTAPGSPPDNGGDQEASDPEQDGAPEPVPFELKPSEPASAAPAASAVVGVAPAGPGPSPAGDEARSAGPVAGAARAATGSSPAAGVEAPHSPLAAGTDARVLATRRKPLRSLARAITRRPDPAAAAEPTRTGTPAIAPTTAPVERDGGQPAPPVRPTLVQRAVAPSPESAPEPSLTDVAPPVPTGHSTFEPAQATASGSPATGQAPAALGRARPALTAVPGRPLLRLASPSRAQPRPAALARAEAQAPAPATPAARGFGGTRTSGARLAATTGGLLRHGDGDTETLVFPHPEGGAFAPAFALMREPDTSSTPDEQPSSDAGPAQAAPAPSPAPAAPAPGGGGGGGDIEEIYDQVIERLRRDLLADRERMGDVLGDLP